MPAIPLIKMAVSGRGGLLRSFLVTGLPRADVMDDTDGATDEMGSRTPGQMRRRYISHQAFRSQLGSGRVMCKQRAVAHVQAKWPRSGSKYEGERKKQQRNNLP